MPQIAQGRVRFGSFELDSRAGELRHDGQSVILQEQQLKVLLTLIERAGEIATREEIKKKLWPNDTIVEFDFGINSTIKKLRGCLGDSADVPTYIQTIPRRGYRLLVPVEWVSADDSSALDASDDSDAILTAKVKVGRLTGKVVSHYRVLEVVGGGGMGLVYRAEDLKLGRAVALKFLPEEVGDDPKARERFDREAHAVSALNHHNICTVYDFDEHEGHLFIAMELLQGKTLRDHVADGHFRLTEPEGLEIAIQIASGLEAAHEKGIIHRDIKPANIFITEKNVAKILDFGVAKVMQLAEPELTATASDTNSAQNGAAYLTRTGTKLGTAGYMSPEQIRGEPLDARTDIFSFGLVLYEMATRERAFTGETEAILHDAIVKHDAKPIREFAPESSSELEEIIGRCLQKEPNQRFQSAVEVGSALAKVENQSTPAPPQPQDTRHDKRPRRKRWLASSLTALMLFAAAALYRRAHTAPKLTDKDTIVLAEFENKTGDEVFDGSLNEALKIGLEQTPFLNFLAQDKVNRVAKEIGLSHENKLTIETAKQICLKTNSAAVVAGSISDAGNGYRIGLKALRCDTSVVIASTDTVAQQRNVVISELGRAAVNLRKELGESSRTIHEFNQPLEIATTSSVEALKSFTVGQQTRARNGNEAESFFRRAVEIDPNFALAHARLGSVLTADSARESRQRAYDLRDRATKRQYFEITGKYSELVTGDLEKAVQQWTEMSTIYPNDPTPHPHLAWTLLQLGRYADAATEAREAIRLEPDNSVPYTNLMESLISMERYAEANAAFDDARSHGLDNEDMRYIRYRSAVAENDTASMQEQMNWLEQNGAPETVPWVRAETEISFGHLKNYRLLQREAIAAWEPRARSVAAQFLAEMAIIEEELGDSTRAKQHAAAALALSPERIANLYAAYALASLGDVTLAGQVAQRLKAENPTDHWIKNYEPSIEVAIAANQGRIDEAMNILQASCPNNPNQPVGDFFLCSYIRGVVDLKRGEAKEAAAAFQQVVDHPGQAGAFHRAPAFHRALAHLQLARAQAMAGDKDAARKSYQDFLTLWKDADRNIPIYRQAKAEYKKLK